MLNRLKKFFKKSRMLTSVYELIFQRPIIDLYRSKYSRRVLFSYSTYHFSKENYISHSNYQESKIIAQIFHDFGYCVDVVNNNRYAKLDLSKYDIIFGEGLPMYQVIKKVDARKIYYGTGSHPWHCNRSSLSRMVNFYRESAFLAPKSTRQIDERWGIAASCADAVICIGNDGTKKTFIDAGAKNVLSVDPTYHKRRDSSLILKEKRFEEARKTALWFGSYGLLHKGLDLAVEAFRETPDWTLFVCGYLDQESDFIRALDIPSNVVLKGFLDINSDDFRLLAGKCGFVILPSCSEGTATAVLTTVGNGGMIPIVTRECGFDIEQFGFHIDLSVSSITGILDDIDSCPTVELEAMAWSAYENVSERYTIKNFESKMRENLGVIINAC